MVPAQRGGGGAACLMLLTVRDGAIDEPVYPAILATHTVLDIAVRIPVQPAGEVHVIVGRPVVSDIGDLPVVRAIRPNQIVEAELGDEDARMSSRPQVLENERQPEYGDIAHVQ